MSFDIPFKPGELVGINGFTIQTTKLFTKTEVYVMPRCDVKTKSVIKRYRRWRKKHRRMTFRQVPDLCRVVQVGKVLIMHPDLWEKVKASLPEYKA